MGVTAQRPGKTDLALDRYDLIVIGAGSAARDAARKASTRVRREGRPRRAHALGRLVSERRLQADEGVPRRRRAAPRPQHARSEARPRRARRARATSRAIHAWKESLKKPQEQLGRRAARPGLRDLRGNGDVRRRADDPRRRRGADVGADPVATGSRTAVPPIPGLDELDWIDHVSALELEELPESLLVARRRPGRARVRADLRALRLTRDDRRTTAPQIAPRSDADATDELRRRSRTRGSTSSRTRPSSASTATDGDRSRDGDALSTPSRCCSRRAASRTSRSSASTGSASSTTGAGSRSTSGMRTNVERHLGRRRRDRPPPVHADRAVPGAHRRRRHVRAERRTRRDYSILPTAIFTDPELGAVGLTEAGGARAWARRRDRDASARERHAVAVRRRAKHGLYKLVFERASRRVLGIHVVSRNASDIVQGFALALRARRRPSTTSRTCTTSIPRGARA